MESTSASNAFRLCLLLNASFEPLRVISWQRAFALVFQEKVEVLEQHHSYVQSVAVSFRVPAVIRLRRWVKLKRRPTAVKFSRSNLYLRDEYRCQYCHSSYPEKELTLDHVIPVARGGKKSWENIVTACLRCNQVKGHKSPEEVGLSLLRPPIAPRWLPAKVGPLKTPETFPIWEPYISYLSEKSA